MRSFKVTPPGRLSGSRIVWVLLPSRAPFSLEPLAARAALAFWAVLGAFLAGAAFLPDLAFFGATCAPRARTWAFFVAFGSSVVAAGAVSMSVFDVMLSPLAVITAVTTSIPLVRRKSK